MRVVIDQQIMASAQEAQQALLDRDFYAALGELEGISAPEVRTISVSPDAGTATVVIGYRFDGQLNGTARNILVPAKLTWVQETHVDINSRRSSLRMLPDNYQKLLTFSGWYELRDQTGNDCAQHLEADLRVHVPFVGPLAEKALCGSIRQNIATTAELIGNFVASRRGGRGHS